MRILLTVWLLTFSIAAAEEPKDAGAWLKELSATYAKHEGFTATYISKGDGKSLDVVVGVDEASGLAALHLLANKNGRKLEVRQWSTANDELFSDPGSGEVMLITGIGTELKSIAELKQSLAVAPGDLHPDMIFCPSMLVTKDSIAPSFNLANRDNASWTSTLKNATLGEVNEVRVTFRSAESGELTISRETGLLLRQSMTADDGEVRVLELKEHRLNPGADEVAKISAGWKTEDAKVMARGSMLAPLRLRMFQGLIDTFDDNAADLKKLEAALDTQREPLRRFADGFAGEVGGSLASKDWNKLLDTIKDAARKDFPGDGTAEEKEKALDTLLARPEFREKFRDKVADTLVENQQGREIVMFEICGKNRAATLTAKTPQGETARTLLETALCRAYFEAVLDRKMAKHWGERMGLD